MTSMTHQAPGRHVTVGVDTHQDVHVAVALDGLGARLGELRLPTTLTGYRELEHWAADLGPVEAFGIEGTGSYGAGLARYLGAAGHRVVEVNRPDRAARRRLGKSDPIDAEMAARAVLSGVATGTPKAGDGSVEMVRMLKIARDSAVKARTQSLNQLRSVLVTAPAELRESLAGLSTLRLLGRCAAFRTGVLDSPTAAARHTLRSLARRNLALRAEAKDLEAGMQRLLAEAAPDLLGVFGVGTDSAATLLISAGDNPERIGSEAAFAALCGSSPVPASSGKTTRHRLNRGGDRRANAALHRVILVRLRWHEPTQAYMARRIAEGKTTAEVIRCLKRYLAREIYHLLRPSGSSSDVPDRGIQPAVVGQRFCHSFGQRFCQRPLDGRRQG